MLNRLLRSLLAPAPAPLNKPDAKLALAALLVRVARADNDYAATETLRIDLILAHRHGLTPIEAAALRHQAEALESRAPDTVRFTRAIKDAVPYEDRSRVVEALWQVALADGLRDSAEDAQLRLISKLLGINDRDSALIRHRVARQISGSQD